MRPDHFALGHGVKETPLLVVGPKFHDGRAKQEYAILVGSVGASSTKILFFENQPLDQVEAAPAKFDELAHVCNVPGGGRAFVPWLQALKASVGIAGPLSAHGVTAAQIPRLVEIATADICHQTNPRPCTSADFEALFKAAM